MVIKTSVSIEENLLTRIDEHCKKFDVKRSSFIQQAVEHELNIIEGNKNISLISKKDNYELIKLFNELVEIISLELHNLT